MKKLILLLFISYLGNSLFAHEQFQGSRARGGTTWVSPSSKSLQGSRDGGDITWPHDPFPVGSPDMRGESPISSSMRDNPFGPIGPEARTYKPATGQRFFEE